MWRTRYRSVSSVSSCVAACRFTPAPVDSLPRLLGNIDEHAAQSPVARHAARFFGPAQARPGTARCVPGPARTIPPGRAWAAGYARRAARPGPPKNGKHGPAGLGSGQRQAAA
jgi:hypothetical protein